MLAVHVDPNASDPPFAQLRAAVVEAVATGVLAPGEKLPTVRAWADLLGIAPGTVARAFKELEAAGVIETRGRSGTFVRLADDPVLHEAQRAAREFAARMRALGIDDARAVDLVGAALRSSA